VNQSQTLMKKAPAKKAKRIRLMKPEDRKKALKAFGNHLKQLRESKGLSQLKLGARCSMDSSNVNKYEAGRREPGLGVIMIIAKGLGVDHRELLDFTFDFEYNKVHEKD
jgi:ribosome-binding protein aMBF1 (putative translation factor)